MFAAIAALPSTAGKLYDPVTDLPAANRTGATLFDFNHTASQTIESGAIAQINDRFGNGFSALQLSADNRPVSSANGMGSLTTASFDGSNDFLDATASMENVSRNVGALSIHATATGTDGDPSRHIFYMFSSVIRVRFALNASGGIVAAGVRLDSDSLQDLVVTSSAATVSCAFSYSTAKLSIYSGGVVTSRSGEFQTAGNTSDTACSFVRIGATGATTGRLLGHIADILVTPSILADLDRIDYEGWQAQRGSGLAANLPATHRYRYQHPRTRTPK
jgi:hypothetical protein